MLIHQIFWKFKDKELSEIPVFKKNVQRTKQFCKEHNYQYKMWNLKMCEELIVEKYPEYICLWSEFRFDIQRCDFIRYLILHQYGGWYVDCDVYPIQNLDSLKCFDECFTTWSNDVHRKPYNAVMYSVAKNPLFIEIMKKVEKRVIEKQANKFYDTKKGRLVYFTTGHHMLHSVVPKSSIHELMLIHNEEKNIYVCANNPYFYDENITSWWVKKIWYDPIVYQQKKKMIPKIIHQIWIQFEPHNHKKIEDNELFKLQNETTIKFCKENGIKYVLHTDETCNELLSSKYPEHIDFYNNLRYPTQKCDFLRYLVICEYGGLYLDMDVSPLKDLSEVWKNEIFLAKWASSPNIPATAVMAGRKDSSFFKEVIKHFYESYEEKKDMNYYKKWKGKFIYQTSAHYMVKRVIAKQEDKITLWDVMNIQKENLKVVGENPLFLDFNVNSWNVTKTCSELA